MDSELQIGLVALGLAAVVGIIGYNKWQERKHRKHAESTFPSEHRDVLLDPLEPGEASSRSRIEPQDPDEELPVQSEPREPRISIPAAAGRRSTPGAPELVDTRVDCMIRIESIEPLEVQRLWTAQRETLKDLSRSLRWFGFDDAGNLWRPLTAHSAGCFHWYCAATQMVDRRGAISDRDFNIFATGVHRVGWAYHLK